MSHFSSLTISSILVLTQLCSLRIPSHLRILKGGCASGFRHVNPVEYKPRLLHFHGKGIRNIEVKEVRLARCSLDSSDVFILDNGLRAYQWNGKESNKDEKFKVIWETEGGERKPEWVNEWNKKDTEWYKVNRYFCERVSEVIDNDLMRKFIHIRS